MRDYSVSRDTVIEFGIVLKELIDLFKHLFAIPFSHFFTCLVYARVMLLRLLGCCLSHLFFCFFASCFTKQPVSLEKVEIFLQLPTLWLIKREF